MLPPGKKSSRRSQRWRCFCFHIKESPTLLTDTSFSLTRSIMFTDPLSLKSGRQNRKCRKGLTVRISMSLVHRIRICHLSPFLPNLFLPIDCWSSDLWLITNHSVFHQDCAQGGGKNSTGTKGTQNQALEKASMQK